MNQKIEESSWLNCEDKIKHLLSLLEIYSRNYYLAREQFAKWGSALAPPIVLNNLREAEDAVENTIEDLESVLTNLYGKEVN
jgi:hypothetical protein